jgi:two-component system KDP operon response regulator KdpE
MSDGFRVLLVEGDDPLRRCLDEVLAAAGYQVAATAFGAEAIHLARTQPFDFSILDFHLPGMNGLEVLKAIRAFRPMPSIMMSGLASQEEATLAQQAGAFTFLRKPLDLAELRATVNQLIRLHFQNPRQPGLR